MSPDGNTLDRNSWFYDRTGQFLASEQKDVSAKYVKKWRPLMSLLNRGFKTGSKAITLQFEMIFHS